MFRTSIVHLQERSYAVCCSLVCLDTSCFYEGEGRTASSSYRAVNTFHLGYKNQSVYAVSDTSRCLFSDKYKTYKYSVGRAYSCWMLNCWCITWPVGFKRLTVRLNIIVIVCDKYLSRRGTRRIFLESKPIFNKIREKFIGSHYWNGCF